MPSINKGENSIFVKCTYFMPERTKLGYHVNTHNLKNIGRIVDLKKSTGPYRHQNDDMESCDITNVTYELFTTDEKIANIVAAELVTNPNDNQFSFVNVISDAKKARYKVLKIPYAILSKGFAIDKEKTCVLGNYLEDINIDKILLDTGISLFIPSEAIIILQPDTDIACINFEYFGNRLYNFDARIFTLNYIDKLFINCSVPLEYANERWEIPVYRDNNKVKSAEFVERINK